MGDFDGMAVLRLARYTVVFEGIFLPASILTIEGRFGNVIELFASPECNRPSPRNFPAFARTKRQLSPPPHNLFFAVFCRLHERLQEEDEAEQYYTSYIKKVEILGVGVMMSSALILLECCLVNRYLFSISAGIVKGRFACCL